MSVTHWNNAAIYLLLHDKLLWQRLLHFSWALKHLHFKLLHFFCKAAQLHFDKSLSASCCTFQVFTKWNKFIVVNVTVLQQLLTAAWSQLEPRVWCGNGVEVVFIHVDDDTQDVARVSLEQHYPMLPACSSMRDLLTILSAWSVRHSTLALFLSPRMLKRSSAVQAVMDWVVEAERLEAVHHHHHHHHHVVRDGEWWYFVPGYT